MAHEKDYQWALYSTVPAGQNPRVDKWEITEPIAHGSFGETYKVNKTQTILNQTFQVHAVLKLVRTNVPNAGSAIKSLRNEMEKLSQINSRFVAKLIEGGLYQLGNHFLPYIVVDWIDGHSLATVISNRRRQGFTGLSPSQFRTLAENTLRGLKSAHDKNMMHLDIKPENIIYNESDDAYVLIDFGLAHIHHRETLEQFVGGTPGYIPPEALQGKTSKKADVFSLGMTFYQSITGKNPLHLTFFDLLEKHGAPIDGDWRLHQLSLEQTDFDYSLLSQDQRALIEPMLDYDPKKRPSLEHLIELAGQLEFSSKSKKIERDIEGQASEEVWLEVWTQLLDKVSAQPKDKISIVIDHEKYFQLWFKSKIENGELFIVCNKPKDHLGLSRLGWIPNQAGSLKYLVESPADRDRIADVILNALRYGYQLSFPFAIT